MPLLDDYDQANVDGSSDWFKRVYMALVSTAVAIQAESVSTANHASRSAYAIKVLAEPYRFTQIMLPSFTVDDVLNPSTATDTDIKNRSSAIWNAYCVQS